MLQMELISASFFKILFYFFCALCRIVTRQFSCPALFSRVPWKRPWQIRRISTDRASGKPPGERELGRNDSGLGGNEGSKGSKQALVTELRKCLLPAHKNGWIKSSMAVLFLETGNLQRIHSSDFHHQTVLRSINNKMQSTGRILQTVKSALFCFLPQ